MGKGDRKSRRGKIWRGSFGNTRPKKRKKAEPETPTKRAAPKARTTRKPAAKTAKK
jgi:30S ribosomal protein S31